MILQRIMQLILYFCLFLGEMASGPSKNLNTLERGQGQPCPQSPASGPACRPLSGDKTYRRCGRARRLRRLPAASSSKLDLIRERTPTPFLASR